MKLDGWWRWRENLDAPAEAFPAKMAWLLENPVSRFLGRRSLDDVGLAPGMRVLDVGAGPGRIAIPAAERVGPDGEVVALDLQPEMLEKLDRNARRKGLTNLRTLVGGAGTGMLAEEAGFDRALLVSVLGEIPADLRDAALTEIQGALRPGGALVVIEEFSDPHYRSPDTVTRMGSDAGFRPGTLHRRLFGYTLLLEGS